MHVRYMQSLKNSNVKKRQKLKKALKTSLKGEFQKKNEKKKIR